MLLHKDQVQHVSSIAHAGKIVVIATCDDRSLHYTVRQDGYEQSCLQAQGPLTGWESWRPLLLPDDAVGDPSVTQREQASLGIPKGAPAAMTQQLMRSCYQSRYSSAAVPVQLVSTPEFLYVFRQSTERTLLVDRFVLDGISNELKPKIEVRYQRSKQKYSSARATGRKAGGIQSLDTLDFTDVAGNYFYEPSTELCFIKNVSEGRFAVLQVPTSEHGKYRWHIFLYQVDPATQGGLIELVSLRASEEGLFDVKDSMVFEADPRGGAALVPRVVPGIIRRTLDLRPARVLNGPAATLYDIQKEVVNAQDKSSHLLRTESRVMLAVPTDQGITTLSFAIASDGTLSQISDAPGRQQVLRSDEHVVLLPINTLDDVVPLGAALPPPQGTVSGVMMGTEADQAKGHVIVSSPEAGSLAIGDVVALAGTPPYDGLYQVRNVLGDSFEIAPPLASPNLGTWEKQPVDDEDSLLFDGMLTAYKVQPDGKLLVSAANHGLAIGDQVQIVGSTSYDGEYAVTPLDGTRFLIETPWAKAAAQNVKLIGRRRRGVEFDGRADSLTLPSECLPLGGQLTISLWVRSKDDGSDPKRRGALLQAVADDGHPVCVIQVDRHGLRFSCGAASLDSALDATVAQPFGKPGEWTHWAFTKDVSAGELKIYKNGALYTMASGKGGGLLAPSQRSIQSISVGQGFQGTLAELRIFDRALHELEIRNSMWVPLSGNEANLQGYWPLGAIVEEAERTVLDFSPHGRDGRVGGGAYVSACVLPLFLADGKTPAAKFRNSELFAVTQGATYLEEFEFRLDSPSKIDPRNADGKLHPLFQFSYWGQRDRSAAPQAISGGATVFTDLGGGWYRAACNVTIPAGVCLLRSFEIAQVTGTFTAQDLLAIRRHKISLVSDAITETRSIEAVAVSAPPGSPQQQLLSLHGSCREIAALEQQEGALLLEQASLRGKLARISDLAALQVDLSMLSKRIAELATQTGQLLERYNQAAADPRNYVCRLQVQIAGAWFFLTRSDNLLAIHPSRSSRIRFSALGGDCFGGEIEGDATNWQGLFVFDCIPSAVNGGGLAANRWGWDHLPVRIGSSPEALRFRPAGDACYLDILTYPRDQGTFIPTASSWHKDWCGLAVLNQDTTDFATVIRRGDTAGNLFRLLPTTEIFGAAIDEARAAWQKSKIEYDSLVEFQKTLQDLGAGSATDYQGRLAAVDSSLSALRARMAARQSKTFLSEISLVNDGGTAPVSWPMEKLATDRRGLVTQRASLPFARTGSRVSALQTCEGHVQLAYVDQDGRMQQVIYNATADRGAATTFDRWFPAPPRGCYTLGKNTSVIIPEQPILLGDEWTIEAWFYYPLPATAWNVLTSQADGQSSQIVVREGKYLGTRIGELFLSSGYSLAGLAPGWHHVAAVKRGRAKQATLDFYVDGEAVGDRLRASGASLAMNGGSDVVTLSRDSLPSGSALSFAVTTRDSSGPLAAYLLRATDSAKAELLGIRLNHTATTGTIEFVCGADTLSYKFDRPKQEAWTHWVFVKNVTLGTMSIYRDGRLAIASGNRRAPLPTTVAELVMGQGYAGSLLEPSLWGKELWASEVGLWLGRVASGGEDALYGSWGFAERSAPDRGPKRKSGSVVGTATPVPLLLDGATRIERIGNVPPKELGATQAAVVSPNVVTFNGSSTAVQLAPASLPTGNELTICFWLKGASSLPSYTAVLSAWNAQGSRVLLLHLPWNDSMLYFDCGATDSNNYDRIETQLTPQQYKGTWNHWALTKNAATGEMKVYCNGVLILSGSGKTRAMGAVQSFTLGALYDGKSYSSYYPGQVAELCIFSKALSQAEIQACKDRIPSGSEPNLCAYYRFDAGKVVDLGPYKRDGQYVGPVAIAPDAGLRFTSTPASVPAPGQQFGKLAELRVWDVGLSSDEIAANSTTILTGNEPGLLAYYAMRSPVAGRVRGHTETDPDARLSDGEFLGCNPPIGNPGSGVLACAGVGDFVALPAMKIDFAAGLTLEAWILQCDGKQNLAILDLGNGPLGGARSDVLRMSLLSSGALLVQVASGTKVASLQADGVLELGRWTHVAVTIGTKNQASLYKNGLCIKTGVLPLPPTLGRANNYLGQSDWQSGAVVAGQLAEVRIFNTARPPEELQATLNRSLCGKENGLAAYWPLDRLRPGNRVGQVEDHGPSAWHGTLYGSAQIALTNDLPVGLDAIVSAEYSTLGLDPKDPSKKQAMMRRFFGGRVLGAAMLLPDKRIEAAELVWVGNGQFQPTLLGYIEGAPPVPSENLTEGGDYNGATSVELSTSEELTYSWNQTKSSSIGGSLDFFVGIDTETLGGLGVYEELLSVRAGLTGSLSATKEDNASTSISSTSSKTMADRVELRGTTEAAPAFPELGPRFVPKNVGYALVISSLADVFITRLAKSGRMVGYTVLPVEGIPPDVNTISFLMNPAYVMQGSLDGMTGSRAASERYHRNVPEMRSQYGSLYPSSYFRILDAYALKQKIEGDDKRRAAYFAQFSASDPSSFAGQLASAADGDKEGAAAYQQKIRNLGDSESARVHAASCFAGWQQQMETLLIQAGKRNIVNTYVWDANGGLHTDQQGFSSTVEHSIGGSFSFDSSLGFESNISVFGAAFDLSAMSNLSLTQTVSKTQSATGAVQLNVDLSGVEFSGITDALERPIVPGEKVSRYRFMTFYLEGSTDHFNHFFHEVVDPQWLQSNGEGARALRQAMGKANKAWRVLHRVTYVERPALQAVDGDTRALPSQPASDEGTDELLRYFGELAQRHQALVSRMDRSDAQLRDLSGRLDQLLKLLSK